MKYSIGRKVLGLMCGFGTYAGVSVLADALIHKETRKHSFLRDLMKIGGCGAGFAVGKFAMSANRDSVKGFFKKIKDAFK